MLKPATLAALLTATTAQANLSVRFDEGAPKDRFTLTNTGDCTVAPARVTLDLGAAPSGLIFDVTASGAGVEVFQPFEIVAGQDNLTALPQVSDGQSAITLDMSGLAKGASISFTIDVDDTGGDREITVSGSEIAGALVQVDQNGAQLTGVFTDRARAVVATGSCLS